MSSPGNQQNSTSEDGLLPVAQDSVAEPNGVNDPAPVAVPEVEEAKVAEDPIAPTETSMPAPIADNQEDIFDEPEVDNTPVFDDEDNGIDAPVEERSVEDELDEILGEHNLFETLQQNGGLASQATRLWTDNTGRYQCKARLLLAAGRSITLVKSNGAKKEVSLSRLSNEDLHFVRDQVSAYNEVLASDSALEKIALLMRK